MAIDFSKIIPTGKSNAISTEELIGILKLSDARVLRMKIAEARNDGQLICSTTAGGYYFPAARSELQEYVEQMEGRAKAIFHVLKASRHELEQIEGQLNF